MLPVTAAEGSSSLTSSAVTLGCPPFAWSLCQATVSPSALPKAWWHKQAVSSQGETATLKGTQLCPPGQTHPSQEPWSPINGNHLCDVMWSCSLRSPDYLLLSCFSCLTFAVWNCISHEILPPSFYPEHGQSTWEAFVCAGNGKMFKKKHRPLRLCLSTITFFLCPKQALSCSACTHPE